MNGRRWGKSQTQAALFERDRCERAKSNGVRYVRAAHGWRVRWTCSNCYVNAKKRRDIRHVSGCPHRCPVLNVSL